jgi:hypothetical protein
MLVSGWQQALTLVVLVIPGFVYQGVRTRFRGPTPEDRELGVRVLRALAGSAMLAFAYTIVLGPVVQVWFTHPRDALHNIRAAAASVIVLVFAVPAAAAVAVHVRTVSKICPGLALREKFRVYNPTPTAWDFASSRVGPGYVRVLTKDGRWVGGYAGPGSFFTSYPEDREIFVEQAWAMDDDGEFDAGINGPAGQWIRCDDAQIVQFLLPQEHETSTAPDTVDNEKSREVK